MISKIDINRIAEATDIVDLISQEVSLKRQGSGLVGCCPFHQEKTGSFHVSEARQTYHCFGCHKHGDVFSWVMERDGLTFYEAVRKLAKRANIELKERERTAEEIAAETKREAMLMTTARGKGRGIGSPSVNTNHRYMGIRWYFESDYEIWRTKVNL